ncbi:MAG: hypothetical protein ACUVXI_01605 [bacterium]
MRDAYSKWPDRDLLFMVETLIPERGDKEHVAEIIRGDEGIIEGMLGDERLLKRLMGDEEVFLKVSPRLLFTVLLKRVRADLEGESYTVERRRRESVAVFDTSRVAELLDRTQIRDYIADMLSSFTRIESFSVPIRVRRGVWYKYKFSDFDVDSLMRYCQNIDEVHRFPFYKRIADVCLFVLGVFPEYVESSRRYPFGEEMRYKLRGLSRRSVEDYEEEGKRFYDLAAKHDFARARGIGRVLSEMSEKFALVEKALNLMSFRYLQFTKHKLFGI